MKPVPVPKSNPKLLIPTSRDEDILRVVYTYRFVTYEEILYLLFSQGSRTYARSRLARLAGGQDYANSYLYRFPLPTTRGNSTRIYTLGSLGRELLASLGQPCDWHFQPAKVRNFSHSHIVHNILLSRVVVYAHAFCTRHDITLESRLSYDLARDKAFLVPARDGAPGTIAVVPDALLFFTRSTGERQQILFELDRGFEGKPKFLEHVRARIDLVQNGSYTQVFGERSIRIAYLTTGNTALSAETRRQSMTAWTTALLKEMFPKNASAWASLFHFACIDPDAIYQTPGLLTLPLWYQPGSPEPVPLLGSL